MKHCKFNASFRKSALAVANELELEFVSTPTQIKNGTLKFNDPETDVQYALHESGYIRRYIKGYQHHFMTEAPNNMYPLNRRNRDYCADNTYYLASPDEQLGIMCRAVMNYRINQQS